MSFEPKPILITFAILMALMFGAYYFVEWMAVAAP